MDNEIVLLQDDEEFLDSLFRESEFVCASCLYPVETDEGQTNTYCEVCEAFTEVKRRDL